MILVCRECHSLIPENAEHCPLCKGTDFTEDWSGVLIIIDPESEIARKSGIKKRGKYALRVR
ncbi:MAG: transcription elongation factor subunit Spt4 [Candidatus Methanofastidiosia archaeon]